MNSAKVYPGESIPNGGENRTGYVLRVPGGTKNYYPAFWVRDAAMMLGADLVPATEIEGWIKVVAKTQPGQEGLSFAHGLRVPAYSIPDHITLDGQACWYPGAYTDQGVGNYGFLPPADDAFFFIQMVWEHYRLTHRAAFLTSKIGTGSGNARVIDVATQALQSVATNPINDLVVCSPEAGKGRVDWGFCDSIKKSGDCLMPSLLRWQALERLAVLHDAAGQKAAAISYRRAAIRIQGSILAAFYHPLAEGRGMLLSATEKGKKDDVWASAFAVWLGVLPADRETSVCRHLLGLYREGGIVAEGQVRQMPPNGEYGGFWESMGPTDSYQNAGYWATPTGWLAVALGKVDRTASDVLVSDFVKHVKANRVAGAPFEWINPATGAKVNGNYGSSAGLVYISLAAAGRR